MEDFDTAFVAANKKAACLLQELKEDLNCDKEKRHRLFLEYVKCRFMLDGTEVSSDSIQELAEQSVMHQAGSSTVNIQRVDAPGCTGASAAMDKKILLIMKLEKEFGIHLDPSEQVKIKTVKALAEHFLPIGI